jgi:2-amino-4-hydroxy-6-hydroxymethyldihydropteridine diphosphokinase
MATAYIGIGSNLEDPCLQVKTAILNLDRLQDSRLLAKSSLYSSKPQGPQDQPDFVNAVVKINTSLTPNELLVALQQQELKQGKKKIRHWGERLIDLDILLYDDLQMQTEQLIIPHPQMHLRDFVLLPLAEITPKIQIPNQQDIADLIMQLESKFVTKEVE